MEQKYEFIYNRVQLLGNLGRDPELREFAGNRKRATFSLATNERLRYGADSFKEETQWHNVVAWGSLAQRIADELKKGSRVAVQGRLVHRSYDGKDGQRRFFTEVAIYRMEVMGTNASGEDPVEKEMQAA